MPYIDKYIVIYICIHVAKDTQQFWCTNRDLHVMVSVNLINLNDEEDGKSIEELCLSNYPVCILRCHILNLVMIGVSLFRTFWAVAPIGMWSKVVYERKLNKMANIK